MKTTGEQAISPPDVQKRAIGRKLAVISRQLWQQFDQNVQSAGVSRAKWGLIAAVARRPGATQRAIAAMLQVTEVTAGRMIDRLCDDGLLERRENPQDRRGYCLYLTTAAKPLLDRLGEAAAIYEAEAFAGLSEADLAQLETLLDIIARNVAAAAQRQESRKSDDAT
ncbi:MAG: winged helix DNA-binding domain protein [Hydrocarboniphaga sp.]|uniref:MarR family winged helix-turn-helix transcriptional regulator n=1 Tax=Hydrocarboniphaga sp. TaxID=2033016 RepID=UPI0026328CC1|nr:MarR family transcriptional regulator [Hydrocarboniphaga sp.]MDB5968706.1 winged helix DNA-binding domain protein [Hydrocarboniphaga sp.]